MSKLCKQYKQIFVWGIMTKVDINAEKLKEVWLHSMQ